jgi:hypothetical protein
MAKPLSDDDVWEIIEPLLLPAKPGDGDTRDASRLGIVKS